MLPGNGIRITRLEALKLLSLAEKAIDQVGRVEDLEIQYKLMCFGKDCTDRYFNAFDPTPSMQQSQCDCDRPIARHSPRLQTVFPQQQHNSDINEKGHRPVPRDGAPHNQEQRLGGDIPVASVRSPRQNSPNWRSQGPNLKDDSYHQPQRGERQRNASPAYADDHSRAPRSQSIVPEDSVSQLHFRMYGAVPPPSSRTTLSWEDKRANRKRGGTGMKTDRLRIASAEQPQQDSKTDDNGATGNGEAQSSDQIQERGLQEQQGERREEEGATRDQEIKRGDRWGRIQTVRARLWGLIEMAKRRCGW